MIDIVGRVRWIRDRANQIFDLVTAIFTLTETGGTLTSDGTEQTVYQNITPAGVFKPVTLMIDTTNLALGDTIIIRTFYQIDPAGALIPSDEETIVGPPPPAQRLKEITLKSNRYGVEVTLAQTVGTTGNDFDWAVFYEV